MYEASTDNVSDSEKCGSLYVKRVAFVLLLCNDGNDALSLMYKDTKIDESFEMRSFTVSYVMRRDSILVTIVQQCIEHEVYAALP